MKKLVLLFLLVAIGSQVSQMVSAKDQAVRTCITYNNKRTLYDFKEIILTWKDPFIRRELWPAYADIINKSLQERNKSLVITPDSAGMAFVMSHSQEYDNSFFNQNDYLNGARVDDKIEYRDSPGLSSNWSVFIYEEIVCVYAKIFCGNAEKLKIIPQVVQTVLQVIPMEDKPSYSIPPLVEKEKEVSCVVVNNITNNYYNDNQPLKIILPKEKFNWKPVIIIGGVAVGLVGVACGIYSLLNYINGVPGGAPTTPPGDQGVPGGTPTTPPGDEGGPGGSPTTK